VGRRRGGRRGQGRSGGRAGVAAPRAGLLLLPLRHLLLQVRVPHVLDLVIRPPRQAGSDLRPSEMDQIYSRHQPLLKYPPTTQEPQMAIARYPVAAIDGLTLTYSRATRAAL
jgi:hypothetical protein